MRERVTTCLMAVMLLGLITSASQALTPYSQHFEDLIQSDSSALTNDGWLVYGNVFAPDDTYLYGYGPYGAPNHNLAFSQIALGESGENQGVQVLSVFNDYESPEHAGGVNRIESNVYQEQLIGADDVGTSWRFFFEHKLGNIELNSTAVAFIKTLDPSNNYNMTNYISIDMTSVPDTWAADSLEITIDATLEDQLLQIGFSSTASDYEGSGIFYDNLVFAEISAPATGLQVYTQDFEGLDQSSPTALAEDGWMIFGNVFTPDGTPMYGYGAFDAPNHNLAFCQIALGESGDEQGVQVLSVFNDYENLDHQNGNLIEANVFQEQEIGAVDVGTTWRFAFQHKGGNVEGNSTAHAFIKTLDPGAGYSMSNYIAAEMTFIPDTWGGDSLEIVIDASLAGQILQIGFTNTASNYEGSGIFYDNLVFDMISSTDVAGNYEPTFVSLGQNSPNPFNQATRIEFALERSAHVELSVVDITGRRVTTLCQAERGAGTHQVNWNGLTSAGESAPSGIYWYVLRTETGEKVGRMILTK